MATKDATTEATRSAAPARPVRPSALPQGPGYALKRAVLGPALPTARLKHERLGKPTALAVFASDNLSSSAYATEEILKVAVPAVGGAALPPGACIRTASGCPCSASGSSLGETCGECGSLVGCSPSRPTSSS